MPWRDGWTTEVGEVCAAISQPNSKAAISARWTCAAASSILAWASPWVGELCRIDLSLFGWLRAAFITLVVICIDRGARFHASDREVLVCYAMPGAAISTVTEARPSLILGSPIVTFVAVSRRHGVSL